MSEFNYIEDRKLPITMDFDALKEEALSYIQKHSDSTWTNFNAADPGVTILDQVCYALTELGYCSSFPMADLLTDSKGNIVQDNQFYLPNEILRTDAITISDFRKIIIDAYPTVANVAIKVVHNLIPYVSQVYQVYLFFNDGCDEKHECEQIYYFLNKHRNLNAFFQYPLPLNQKKFQLIGKISVYNENKIPSILEEIKKAIINVIFPIVEPSKLIGSNHDDLYDGPLLKNGFIPTSSLGGIKTSITAIEVVQVISQIEGVKSIESLSFENGATVSSNQNELLVADIASSISKGNLLMEVNGVNVAVNLEKDDKVYAPNLLKIRSIDSHTEPEIAKSSFRDVNSYYSIQNTLPAVYGIGDQNAGTKKTALEQAQANQLIGFLTIFDQVLANQFSQLANIDKLFSFKNATTGGPSDLEAYLAKKNRLEMTETYPVPYKAFSPTYFYQSLYDIPDVRPVLKRNETFSFTDELTSKRILDESSWEEYKNDPYNPYIRGVMNAVTDESIDLDRRNNLLNHLLARHGESPAWIDSIVTGSQYVGNEDRDRIIFKSLYLQNLAKLTYHNIRSYDVYGSDELGRLSVNRVEKEVVKQHLLGDYERDFIVDIDQIDESERIKNTDFTSHTSLELKSRILFGFKPMYTDYVNEFREELGYGEKVRQVDWLLNERSGGILLESGTVLANIELSVNFYVQNESWKIQELISRQDITRLIDWVRNNQAKFNTKENTVTISLIDKKLIAEKSLNPVSIDCYSYQLDDLHFTFTPSFSSGFNLSKSQLDKLLANDVNVLFPNYLPSLNKGGFKSRIESFYENNIPAHLNFKIYYLDEFQLQEIIPSYRNWFNGFHYKSKTKEVAKNITTLSEDLVSVLYSNLIAYE